MKHGPCWCAVLVALAHACQSYEERPLDAEAHLDAWEGRLEEREVDARAREWGLRGFDLTDGVELGEARVVALLCHPELAEARREIEVARARGEFAARPADPTLSADVLRAVQAASQPWLIVASLTGQIPPPGRVDALEELGDARVWTARTQAREREVEVLRALDEAWLSWSTDRREIAVLREQGEDLARLREDAARLRRAGSLVGHEARRLDIVAARLDLRLAQLEAGDAVHRMRLLAGMGLRPETPFELRPSPTGLRAGELPSLREALLAHDPQLAVLRATYEQSEKNLAAAIASQWRGPFVGPGVEWDDGDTKLGPSLTVPIPLWNRNQAAIALARAQREMARARFESALEQAESRARIALAAVELGEARVEALRERLQPLVREQWDELRRLAALGELDLGLMLESWNALLELRIERLRAETDCERSRLRLAWAVAPWSPEEAGGGHDDETEDETEDETGPEGDRVEEER